MVLLYKQRLEYLGMEKPDGNTTILKEKLLTDISELEDDKQGRDVILACDEDIVLALSKTSDYPEAIILPKTANILRKHLLNHVSSLVEPSTISVLKRPL